MPPPVAETIPPPPPPPPRYACAHCNGATAETITNWVDDNGNLWRIPVRVCTSARCLRRQGATMKEPIPHAYR